MKKLLPLLLMLHLSTAVYAGSEKKGGEEGEIPALKQVCYALDEADSSLNQENPFSGQMQLNQVLGPLQSPSEGKMEVEEEKIRGGNANKRVCHNPASGNEVNLGFTLMRPGQNQSPFQQKSESSWQGSVNKNNQSQFSFQGLGGNSFTLEKILEDANQVKQFLQRLVDEVKEKRISLKAENQNAQDWCLEVKDLESQTSTLNEVLNQLSGLQFRLEARGSEEEKLAQELAQNKDLVKKLTDNNSKLIDVMKGMSEFTHEATKELKKSKKRKAPKEAREKLMTHSIAEEKLLEDFKKLSLEQEELSKKFNELKQQKEEVINENLGLNNRYVQLQSENESLTMEKQGLEAQISNLNERLQNLHKVENESEELKTRVSNLESQNTQLAQELEKKKQEAQQAINNRNYWQGQYNILDYQNIQLTQELRDKEEEAQQAIDNNDWQEQYNTLAAEIQNLRALKQAVKNKEIATTRELPEAIADWNEKKNQVIWHGGKPRAKPSFWTPRAARRVEDVKERICEYEQEIKRLLNQ